MSKQPNEIDEFFENKGEEEDVFETLHNAEEEEEEEEQPGGDEEPDGEEEEEEEEEEPKTEFKPRNRRERRLMKKLDDERSSAQFLAGKLEAMSAAKLDADDVDYLKGIERIYGTDSPEAIMATDLLKKAIVGARDDAEERAYRRIQQEREASTQAEREAMAELDNMLDTIEDTYNVELSESQEQGFFQLMEKMSPKDSNGNVTAYADPHAVWEVFKERTSRRSTNSKAKQLANRSLTKGSKQGKSDLEDDSTQRFLKESGII